MRTLPINNTDLAVSQLCLGTNQFGTGMDDELAAELCDTFVELGGNFFDTAHSYGDWIPNAPLSASEHTLGRWLAGKNRDDLIIASKGCEFDYRAGDFQLRVSREVIESDLLGSLEALQTDYLDLFWLHRDDPSRPVGELIDALMEQQQRGRIRHFGCSNWSIERIEEAQDYAIANGHSGFVACQPLWGLAEPSREAMQRYCPGGYYEDGYQSLHQKGLTMIPYSSQSRGFFTKLDAGIEHLSNELSELYLSEINQQKLPVIQQIAAAHQTSINNITLAYLCNQAATIPIIGASSTAQLTESANACEIVLTASELESLRNPVQN